MKELNKSNNDKITLPTIRVKNKGGRKLAITSALMAAIACTVCLVPAGLLIVASGGVLALFSTWLGYTIIAALILGSAFILAFGYKRMR